MKNTILILLLCVAIISCKPKNVWTPEYEKNVYNECYAGIGEIVQDSAQRKELAQKMVVKLKQKLPDGINSISTDSLTKLSEQIGREIGDTGFGEKLKAKIAWTDAVTQSIRIDLLKSLGKMKVSASAKNAFCTCAINELQKMYPDSLITPLTDSVTEKVDNNCKDYLLQK